MGGMVMRGVSLLMLALAATGAEISQMQLREVVAQAGAKLDVGELDLSKFSYYSYEDIVAEVAELQADYPDLVNAYTAQEKYGLPSSAQCGEAPCEQWVLEITNKATLPEPARPQVFFSGALHGDERVGPSTAMEFMKLILQEYTEGKNMWIKRLVDTRTIVIMPATNAQGYHEASRTEGTVDVNRDFPIDTTNCMQSITARALNEVWRDHLFQTAITFHGGIQMIVYEWGTVPRSIQTSPDDNAQKQLGSSMSAYAGAFDEGLYPHGAINELLYPVTGGMEDWAYAGSWLGRTNPCSATTFGGYPIERTIYNDTVLRSFNILVETSDDKTPNVDKLGGPAHVLRPEGQNDGHIPRNLRLMLLTADLVEPYVQWVAWDNDVAYAWEVGGAMHVDETYLRYTYETEDGEIVEAQTTSQSGPTRWSGGGRADSADKSLNQDLVYGEDIKLNATDNIDDRAIWPFINAFEAQLELPEGAVIVSVVAEAVVDQTWALQPNEPSPNITPQSHMVNARIIDGYYATNAGYEVKGKKTWSSDVVVFEAETAAPTGVEAETAAPTVAETETAAPTVDEAETAAPTAESAAQSQSPGHFVLVFSTLFFLGLMA